MAAQNQGQVKKAETLKVEVDLRLWAEEKAREEVREREKRKEAESNLRSLERGGFHLYNQHPQGRFQVF